MGDLAEYNQGWSYIDWDHPDKGFYFALKTPDGNRWAAKVYEYLDHNDKEIPLIVNYKGSDDEIVFDLMSNFPDLEESFFDGMEDYEDAIEKLNSLNNVGDLQSKGD